MDKEKVPFPFQAARYSFWAPIGSFFLNFGANAASAESQTASLVIGLLCILLVVSGFILAIYALIVSGQPRRKGHLGYAIAGLILNGLLLLAMVFAIMAIAQAMAEQA